MTLDLDTVFQTRLNSDATLTADLATYMSVPAVFKQNPVPEDANLPYVVSAGYVGDSPFDTKTVLGRDIIKDIYAFTLDDGNTATVNRIAERIRLLFHRFRLTVPDYYTLLTSASGPIVVEGDGVYGRVVSVRVVLTEDN